MECYRLLAGSPLRSDRQIFDRKQLQAPFSACSRFCGANTSDIGSYRRPVLKENEFQVPVNASEIEKAYIMPKGYNQPLYILPFDHRGSFELKMFGWTGPLKPAQTAQIADAKKVIYDAFKSAVTGGVPKGNAGILVDEQFGADILRDARAQGFITACPAEKSGQDEFDFEYGEEFAQHIEAFRPTFCKVLVRYNPEGDRSVNLRQLARLKSLSEHLHTNSSSLFMFELLVPPNKAQLDSLGGDRKAYDRQIRPRLMLQAIHEIQEAQVEPDVWKIEGLDRREDCKRIVATVRRGGRDTVGCIVRGRGEDDEKVRQWLATASTVDGFIGFAVGRTSFWEPLVRLRAKETTRAAAVNEIARRYREFVDIFAGAPQGHETGVTR